MSVFVVHAPWNNRGDEAAVLAMTEALFLELPVRELTIMVHSHNSVRFPMPRTRSIKNYPEGAIDFLDSLATILTLGKKSLTSDGKAFLEALDRSDIVIHSPGGPLIGDVYGGWINGYAELYMLTLASVIKKKRFFFFAPSMGPFSNPLLNIIRKALLSRVGPIVLRDHISARYLQDSLSLTAKVTGDAALINEVPESYLSKYPSIKGLVQTVECSRTVGITVSDLHWHPIHEKDSTLQGRIERAFAALIAYVVSEGYKVLLIPHYFGERDDASLLIKLAEPYREDVYVLPKEIDAYGQQLIISKLWSMVGMRYHSAVFAAKSAVPFVAVSYEHKTQAFMNRLRLSECAMDVEGISPETLLSKYRTMEASHNQIKEHLQETRESLIEDARRTIVHLRNYISTTSE